MRTLISTLLSAACLACAGCQNGSMPPVDDQRGPFNAWVVETLDDESISNAIITQRTLYPYHFVANSAELNPVGERDLKILATYFQKHAGQVSVRRGGENAATYDARVIAVQAALVEGGVEAGSVKVTSALPGGDGISSQRAVEINERMNSPMSSMSGSGEVYPEGDQNGGGR